VKIFLTQLAINRPFIFSTSPNVCFCTTWGKHNQRNITFYPMRYDCLIDITRKNTFCSHFWHCG